MGAIDPVTTIDTIDLLESARRVERLLATLADAHDLPEQVTRGIQEAFSPQGEAFSPQGVAFAWSQRDTLDIAAIAGDPGNGLLPGQVWPATDLVPVESIPITTGMALPIRQSFPQGASGYPGFAFPLMISVEERPLGFLLIWATAADFFSPEALAVLQSVALHVALAVNRDRERSSMRLTGDVVMLTEVVGELTRSLDLSNTLRATLRGVMHLSKADATEVVLFQPNSGTVDFALGLLDGEWVGPGKVPHLYTPEQNAISNLRNALRLPDIQSLPAVLDTRAAPPAPFQSYIVVPLRIRDTLVGLLTAASHLPDSFDPSDQQFLQLLGSQAASAIRNAQLYEESRRHLRETRALFAIGQSIASTLDLDEVLDLVVRLATKTIPAATKCVIHLPNEEGTQLVATAVGSHDGRPLNRRPLPIDQGIAGSAMAELRTILVPDCAKDSRYLDLGTNPRSLVSAPLLSSEKKAIGVITVDSDDPDSFTADDSRLLTTFATQAAIAIENAQLFRRLQGAYRELEDKQAEILKSKNTLQALFDGITDGISIIDRDYGVLAINRANVRFVGKPHDAILGERCYKLFWDRDAPCEECPATETFTTGLPAIAAQQVLREGRTAKTFEAQTYPLADEQGRTSQVIFLARDVTDRRELEASLARSATMAAVGQLAAGLAHEINNPLTVILGNGQMLLEDVPPDHPDYPMVQMIVSAGDRARRVIDRLLDFSAQEGLELSTVDLNETITSATGLVAHALREREVHTITHLQPDLPHMQGYVGHLQTVWMNLILNAVDAVQGDQADHEITISSRQIDADHLQVEVADRGCGIPAGAMKRVFEPFYSTKEPGRGAGLGLYTSYHIVRRHHGTLSVRSEEGQGTTVTATLPLRHTPRDENPGNSPATSQLFEVGIPASRQDTGDEDENEQAT